MKKAFILLAGAFVALLFGANHAQAQRAQTRAPVQDTQLQNTLQNRVADYRGVENVIIHKVEVAGMNQQRVDDLREIALEQNNLILAFDANVDDGTYEVVLNEPDVSRDKLEKFMNSLLAAKAREGN